MLFVVTMIIFLFNVQLKETVLEVEAPLIEKQMSTVNSELERAITEMNWTSESKG